MTQLSLTFPLFFEAEISLPASKSISNRALILNALAGCGRLPQNLSDCDDTRVVVDALRHNPYTIDIGAAGTAMRFLTAYLSVTPGEHVLTGSERMKQRPIRLLVDALRRLGAMVEYVGEEGFPPLKISGHTLSGGELQIAGNVSSQYISALLMIAPTMQRGLRLTLTGEVLSRPYIDMTMGMMRHFGAEVGWQATDTIVVCPAPYRAQPYTVESDWSAASYWFEMVALAGNLNAEAVLGGLSTLSLQGDAVVKDIFLSLGVVGEFSQDAQCSLRLFKAPYSVERLERDFSTCPDLAQTLVCTCVGLGIPFHFSGLSTLKIKETDRIEALKCEMRKLGFVLHDFHDSELAWDGERCQPTGLPIDTYHDHRMAMAFAPLAAKFPDLKINNPEVVSKSYPDFWRHLQKAGFTCIFS